MNQEDGQGDWIPPQIGALDRAHGVIRASLSALPFFGGTAVELFNSLFAPPLERRLTEWRENVAIGLDQLARAERVDFEELQNNPDFIDTVLKASQAAVKTSKSEKLEAFRNAVLNAALPEAPDASHQELFLALVDQFTVWHMRLLKLFQSPRVWFEKNGLQPPGFSMSSLSKVIEVAFPELKSDRDFCGQLWKGLYGSGLVNTSDIFTTMTASGAMEPRTTALGGEFLRFIEAPLEAGTP